MQKILSIMSVLGCLLFSCTPQPTSKNILVLGDSNGASPIGWVVKLDSILVNDTVMNCSKGGRTIGFDNLGRTELNELKMVQSQLVKADSALKTIDLVLIGLGTNDCKACFDSLQSVVPENMDKLIKTVKTFSYQSGKVPEVVLVLPPQVAADSLLLAKYEGIGKRLDNLIPELKKVAEKNGCSFVETRPATTPDFASLTVDGIHFNHKGYTIISNQVYQAIKEK